MIIVAIFSIVESPVVLAILGRSCFSDDYIRDIRRRHYHIAVRFYILVALGRMKG